MNRLADATSPYLLQHSTNPVDWWPWSPEAFAQARADRKPVLLSVGYAACHWCHVMAHESFEDEATAALMNTLFVNIKVDREERPDVDHVYMSALQALGEQGGWPMTMFLTPEGAPFWGGTYFPKEPRFGQPAFATILREVARIHGQEPERVAHNAEALRNALQQALAADATAGRGIADANWQTAPLGRRELEVAGAGLARAFDRDNGGLKGAPKFPNPPMLELLWRHAWRTRDPEAGEAFFTTLRQMARGGIHDHLGGGFARYSVDARWLVPHFEKMLYDNAQLLELFALGAAETGDELLQEAAEGIVSWLAREMAHEDGAFFASLDADSEGEEGRFYVWEQGQIEDLLGDTAAEFCDRYDVSPGGNWEGKTVLNRLRAEGLRPDTPALKTTRERLLATREARVRPACDDKILADWNGLMIAALARASLLLHRPEWLDLARRAFHFVTESMADATSLEGDALGHSWRQGRLLCPGFASDHAAMTRAALILWEATGEQTFLNKARGWLAHLENTYRLENGVLAMTPAEANDLPVRPAPTHDDAMPNANGLYAEALVRLALATGDEQDRDRAERVLERLSTIARQAPAAHCSILNALDLYLNGATISLGRNTDRGKECGDENTPLLAASLSVPYPNRVVVRNADSAGGASVPQDTALVCAGERCSLPLHEGGQIAHTVGQMTRRVGGPAEMPGS